MIQHETLCLGAAAYHGATELVRFLLESGADVNSRDGYGRPPLKYAVRSRKLKTVKVLIAYGADVNAVDCQETALMEAIQYTFRRSNTRIVRLLVASGANVNARSGDKRDGRTPLHFLMQRSPANLETAKLLLDHGADVNAVRRFNYTALHIAAQEGDYAAANFLIQNGAYIQALTTLGATPLHCAVRIGYIKLLGECFGAKAALSHSDVIRKA